MVTTCATGVGPLAMVIAYFPDFGTSTCQASRGETARGGAADLGLVEIGRASPWKGQVIVYR